MTSTHQEDFFTGVEGKVALKYPAEIVIAASLQISLHLISRWPFCAFSKLLIIYTSQIFPFIFRDMIFTMFSYYLFCAVSDFMKDRKRIYFHSFCNIELVVLFFIFFFYKISGV